jgi:CheY-like chemotaxis protein
MSKTVLLVDDDEIFVEAMRAVLERDYQVRTAANGTEALAAIAEAAPDLVVLDVMMDHISEGFDVARRLKGDPATRHIPVIILTGVDQEYSVRMEVPEAWIACERYLEKPVEPAQLLATVRELLLP